MVADTIEGASEQVSADCVTLDLEVVSCEAGDVEIRRNVSKN